MGFSPDVIPVNPFLASGPYEGDYCGTMTLDSVTEECVTVGENVGDEVISAMNVIQVGELISVNFEGDVEESGKLSENRVTIVKHGISDMRMYHLEFGDEGITGTCDCFAKTDGDVGVHPCATFALSLARGACVDDGYFADDESADDENAESGESDEDTEDSDAE